MPKTIVFCADGTWNAPQEHTDVSTLDGNDTHGEVLEGAVTNVVKLFENLAGDITPETKMLVNEQEKVLPDDKGRPLQVAKYIHGVGDSKNLLIRLLGGAFGVGVVSRVVRGYTFISRHYTDGDAIHLTGFSRGAYTARALGGMITTVGLLNRDAYDPNDKTHAYQLGIAAWCKAKRAQFVGGGLSALSNAFLTLLEQTVASTLPPNAFVPDVPIKSIAVWDTVGSMGIPKYAATGRMDVLQFVDTTLSPKVERGFHAMAIDELRVDFPVTEWKPRAGIEQVWFVGAHCDVGGGYARAQSYLSDIAFGWMMKKLSGPNVGVKFAAPLTNQPTPQILGGPFHTPWLSPPFNLIPKRSARIVAATDTFHCTVRDRWDAKTPPVYRPEAMVGFGDSIANARFDSTVFP